MESSGSATSLTLLEKAKNKEELAWERIVELYGPQVYRLCRVCHMQRADARDVVQDVFRAAYGGMERFRHDRPDDSFRGWLLTITKNKIRDFFRRQAKIPAAMGGSSAQQQLHLVPSLEWSSSTSGPAFRSRKDLVQRALNLVRGDFEERTWQAFWQTTIEERNVIDVAESLNVTKWAVYQAKSRVLRRFRDELQNLLK